MADVPHFDLPFRFGTDGHAIEVEQDSLKDVSNCVEAIVSTTVGQRDESPAFGIIDPAFQKQPIDLGSIAEHIIEQEPRATTVLSQAPDQFDELVADVLALVSIRQDKQGVNP